MHGVLDAMKRTLGLRREALADLTPGELGGVVAGNYTSPNGISCGVRDCVGEINVNTDLLNQVLTIPSQILTCYTCI